MKKSTSSSLHRRHSSAAMDLISQATTPTVRLWCTVSSPSSPPIPGKYYIVSQSCTCTETPRDDDDGLFLHSKTFLRTPLVISFKIIIFAASVYTAILFFCGFYLPVSLLWTEVTATQRRQQQQPVKVQEVRKLYIYIYTTPHRTAIERSTRIRKPTTTTTMIMTKTTNVDYWLADWGAEKLLS